MKAAAVVEGCVLEDQATEVTVGSHDVVGLFLLAELVAVVLGLGLGGFTHQGGGHQGAVHGGEQAAAENTCDAQHVEGARNDQVVGEFPLTSHLGLDADQEVEDNHSEESKFMVIFTAPKCKEKLMVSIKYPLKQLRCY